MRPGRVISKIFQERWTHGSRALQKRLTTLHRNGMRREATYSNLQHQMPDRVSLKRPRTGCISNGVVAITRRPNGKLIIRPKIRVQHISQAVFATATGPLFEVDTDSRSRELR